MTVGTLEALGQVAGVNVPDADTLIQGTGSHVVGVGGDGDGGDAVLDGEGKGVATLLNVPETDGAIATTGCDRTTVTGKVQRVNVLLVAGEVVADCAALNVPNL